MAYSEETRRNVRNAFVYKGLPLNAAAESEGVPYETARHWKRQDKKKGDDWDNARAAHRLSKGGVSTLTAEIIEDFVQLFQSTIEEIKKCEKMQPAQKAEAISRLSDAYQKTVNAAGRSSPKLSKLAVAMDVIKRQAEFVRENFPDRFDLFLEMLEPFGEVISREFG